MSQKILASMLLASLLCACSAGKSTPNPQDATAQGAPAQDAIHAAPPMPTQEEMMAIWKKVGTPAENHAAMKQYLGKWKTTSKAWHDLSGKPEVSKGSATFTALLGGRFLKQEFKGKMMGHPFNGEGLLGYDIAQEKFISTWIDSMGTGIMLAYGKQDPASKVVSFDGEFFCPIRKQMVKTRMTMSAVQKKQFVFEMFTDGPEGKEMKMMEIVYSR